MSRKTNTRRQQPATAHHPVLLTASVTALVLLATPAAFAHGGSSHAVLSDPGYIPYTNGMADPLGVTSSRRVASTETATHVTVDNPLAVRVRELNARFADVGAALAEGYAPASAAWKVAQWASTTSTAPISPMQRWISPSPRR